MTWLAHYDAVLVGTIPLDIDLPGSDLDIVCHAPDLDEFATMVLRELSSLVDVVHYRRVIRGVASAIVRFSHADFPIEVFARAIPVDQQNGYLHMVIEALLLEHAGSSCKEAIRSLKAAGLKTEPAFAKYFDLAGDPYDVLRDMALKELSQQAPLSSPESKA